MVTASEREKEGKMKRTKKGERGAMEITHQDVYGRGNSIKFSIVKLYS